MTVSRRRRAGGWFRSCGANSGTPGSRRHRSRRDTDSSSGDQKHDPERWSYQRVFVLDFPRIGNSPPLQCWEEDFRRLKSRRDGRTVGNSVGLPAFCRPRGTLETHHLFPTTEVVGYVSEIHPKPRILEDDGISRELVRRKGKLRCRWTGRMRSPRSGTRRDRSDRGGGCR